MATASGDQASENKRIRQRITDMYAEFVRDVDPRGYITDFLYSCGVVSNEIVQQLRRKETTQECCRSLLHELFSGGNPQAFIQLRTALQKDYRYIVNMIDEEATAAPRQLADAKENDRIRSAVMRMYSDFVNNVDPKGHIMDVLIQHRVVSEDTAEQLRKKKTRKDRCQSMLTELLNGGDPQAFIVLRTALQEHYRYIVDKIDEATTDHAGDIQDQPDRFLSPLGKTEQHQHVGTKIDRRIKNEGIRMPESTRPLDSLDSGRPTEPSFEVDDYEKVL